MTIHMLQQSPTSDPLRYSCSPKNQLKRLLNCLFEMIAVEIQHQPPSFAIILIVRKENVHHSLYKTNNLGFNLDLARRTLILSTV